MPCPPSSPFLDPINPNHLLNEEVKRRDSAPPFVMALTHDELAARNVEMGLTIERLTKMVKQLAYRSGMRDPRLADQIMADLNEALDL